MMSFIDNISNVVLSDCVFATKIFDLLLLDESDLMKSRMCNNFPKKKSRKCLKLSNKESRNIRHNRNRLPY